MAATDKLFAGKIPEIYDRFLVPLILESYAGDLAERVAKVKPRDVLETSPDPPPTFRCSRYTYCRLAVNPATTELVLRNRISRLWSTITNATVAGPLKGAPENSATLLPVPSGLTE